MQDLTSYKVFSRPRSGGDEKLIGMFMMYDHALTKAANRVFDELQALYKSGQSTKELFDEWCKSGSDITITPDDGIPYNSANLARGLAPQVTLDYSLPLMYKVDCTDCLIMPSGAASPSKNWTFYVYAPEVYEGSVANEGDGVYGLMLRATQIMYEDMSAHSMQTEGSSYKLLDMNYKLISNQEEQDIISKGKDVIYFVQKEGDFGKTPPNHNL